MLTYLVTCICQQNESQTRRTCRVPCKNPLTSNRSIPDREAAVPDWLYILSSLSLIIGFVAMFIILIDIAAGHRQHMWIMNAVWPITALYAGPLALWGYFKVGRHSFSIFHH